MPKGIPKKGFRKSKRFRTTTLADIEESIQAEVPSLLAKLQQLTRNVVCPQCGHAINVIDKEVAMFLIDHGIGKPRQKLEMDVTERIELTAVQIEKIIERYKLAQRAMLPEPDEGDGHGGDMSQGVIQL